MAVYIIGYDINKEGAAYQAASKALIEAIKARFPTYWHHLDSTWLVTTESSAVQVRDALTPYLDTNDELLVIQHQGEAAWIGFSERASSWLKDQLSARSIRCRLCDHGS